MAEGAIIVTLEAMKMQNPLFAPKTGIVSISYNIASSDVCGEYKPTLHDGAFFPEESVFVYHLYCKNVIVSLLASFLRQLLEVTMTRKAQKLEKWLNHYHTL